MAKRNTVPVIVKSGDPGAGPASFSRFTLPFAYRLGPANGPPADRPAFVRLNRPGGKGLPLEAKRRAYYTPETGQALFDRVAWFGLPDDLAEADVENITGFRWWFAFERQYDGGLRRIGVRIARPQLALFEFDTSARRQQHEELLSGFLILDAYFTTELPEDRAAQAPPVEQEIHMEDLLDFNEAFRYWREPFSGHSRTHRRAFGDHLGGGADSVDPYFDHWACWFNLPLETDAGRRTLGPPKGPRESPREGLKEDRSAGWMCYADQRAFVWTCAVLPRGFASLPQEGRLTLDRSHWVRLLNVDSAAMPISVRSDFQRDWTERRTYTRWLHMGSAYGFNYHSGVAVVPPETDPKLWQHFLWLYFDPVLLLLYLRVSAFRFSAALSRASQQWSEGAGELAERLTRLADLRGAYELLTNVYRFPLISNQQQAVEMYEYERRALDVDELLDEVHDQLQASHDYLQTAESQRHLQLSSVLGLIGAAGLALALALALLQLQPISEGFRSGAWSLKGLREWLILLATTSGMVFFILLFRTLAQTKLRLGKWFRRRLATKAGLLIAALVTLVLAALAWLAAGAG